jgi:hypothetical protein
MAKCLYSIVPAKVPGHFNIRFTVYPQDALDPLDVGVTNVLCVTEDRCRFEYDGMVSLGYEMVSEVRETLKFLTG